MNNYNIIFDIGANSGEFSIPQLDEKTIIYAFEPTPKLCSDLRLKIKDCAYNEQYRIIQKAVSDYNGIADFYVCGNYDWGCSSLLNFSANAYSLWANRQDFVVTETIKVEVTRLDTFIEQNNIKSIDFLHCDAQGSDLKILMGIGKYLDIIKYGQIEAAAQSDILYNQQNTIDESINFLLLNNFEIEDIVDNDQCCVNGGSCEKNIRFKNKYLDIKK